MAETALRIGQNTTLDTNDDIHAVEEVKRGTQAPYTQSLPFEQCATDGLSALGCKINGRAVHGTQHRSTKPNMVPNTSLQLRFLHQFRASLT